MKQVYLTWPQGRFKALSFSYDDARLADLRLAELFNKHSLKGTFHVNAGMFGEADAKISDDRLSAAQAQVAYAGHEVSAHTWNHPTIARCPADQVALQILEDRRCLEDAFGYPVAGLSYPNGSYNQAIIDLLPGLGIKYARVVGSSESFELPQDPYRWQTTCHHRNELLKRSDEFLALSKKQYLYWFSVWGHSWEFDRDGTWNVIEEACARLGGRDDLWYATALQAFDYLAAARTVRFTVNLDRAWNPSGLELWYSIDDQIVSLAPGKLTVF